MPPPSSSISCFVAKFMGKQIWELSSPLPSAEEEKSGSKSSKVVLKTSWSHKTELVIIFLTAEFEGWGSEGLAFTYLVYWLFGGYWCFFPCLYVCGKWMCRTKASAPIFPIEKKSTCISTQMWTQASQASGLGICKPHRALFHIHYSYDKSGNLSNSFWGRIAKHFWNSVFLKEKKKILPSGEVGKFLISLTEKIE